MPSLDESPLRYLHKRWSDKDARYCYDALSALWRVCSARVTRAMPRSLQCSSRPIDQPQTCYAHPARNSNAHAIRLDMQFLKAGHVFVKHCPLCNGVNPFRPQHFLTRISQTRSRRIFINAGCCTTWLRLPQSIVLKPPTIQGKIRSQGVGSL